MAINRTSITAQPLLENTDITLEILQVRPNENEYLEPAITPNKMFGYFNSLAQGVELWISDSLGRRYIRVR